MLRNIFIVFLTLSSLTISAQKKFSVIGYYAGSADKLDSFNVSQLTHLIFSFGHLKGNRLHISDSNRVIKMVALKAKNPALKIILSLGGWGGCYSCSGVFASDTGRNEFAQSVKALTDFFHTDGIDLDWEYPAIAGHPGHPYQPADKQNFTELVRALRKALGKKQEISFAAGGFTTFIDSAVEWKKLMRLVDKVNIMSYDLVHGFSTRTGHHTPLYSTPEQIESTDHAVRRLIQKGAKRNKLVIGAAFYTRIFSIQDTLNKGLYRPGTFVRGIPYSRFNDSINAANGYEILYDSIAQAPYAFNAARKTMATFDNKYSIDLKTRYARKKRLNGIMFWQLAEDSYSNGLLEQIDITRRQLGNKKTVNNKQ